MQVLAGCVNSGNLNPNNDFEVRNRAVLDSSFLEADESDKSLLQENNLSSDQIDFDNDVNGDVVSSMQKLAPIAWPKSSLRSTTLLGDLFSEDTELQVTADQMPIDDFIHYIFGELLDVNYILDETLSDSSIENSGDVTLSLKNAVSPKELFNLISELFLKRKS